ncbi:MAG: hypothetical protein L6413_07115 [Coriobacteriia bacterium]|nr:hypothetical protein [Coriobacteriia bacterium]
MTRMIIKTSYKEVPVKRFLALAALAVAVCALVAAPAFAEGYNNGGTNYNSAVSTYSGTPGDIADYGKSAGEYVRTPGADQTYSAQGPHGGYTVSTNKCQDCHSTHYAKGSYMLLRANKREDACEFCHGGGGGSTINIQMDNAYDANGPVTSGDRGMGTGHTLGYEGAAPADIEPAYTQANGFACFDCHTPHGNSARVLTTFANPGRAYFEDETERATVGQPATSPSKNWVVKVNGNTGGPAPTPIVTAYGTVYDLGEASLYDAGETLWGLTPVEGNFVVRTGGTSGKASVKPVWPTGRFLLLKNPDVELVAGVEVSDMTTSVAGLGDTSAPGGLYQVADAGENKLAINWVDPLGHADTAYGGEQDKNGGGFPSASTGILSVSEFCTDCHDGTAGASQQPAKVYLPSETDSSTGDYTVAYSHDAQPRH